MLRSGLDLGGQLVAPAATSHGTGGKYEMCTIPKRSRYLIIVSRDRPELCQHLRDIVGEEGIEIVIDRRRPATDSTLTVFGDDRRRPPGPENDISGRQYLIVSRKRDRKIGPL